MDFKDEIIKVLKKEVKTDIVLEEAPEGLGDYALPCFTLTKQFNKNPNEIAIELSKKIKSPLIFKLEVKGPYLNIFINKKKFIEQILKKIIKEKAKYGSINNGKNKKIIVEFSSPNIAKTFGIGHLRSTIIGNSISNLAKFERFKVVRINYLGDWGTPFGKILLGYKKWGDKNKLKENPIKHLLDLYVKVNEDPNLEQEARNWFKKLETRDKETIKIWKEFKELSINDFKRIYSLLGVEFDVYSGESFYEEAMKRVIKELKEKSLLQESEGALIVDLKKYNLGVVLIQKNDGTTLYATRDLAAAIDRYNKYKFEKMIYEVGGEQQLYFQQLFKTLELMGYSWAKRCYHVYHGLYLDQDGKKFATRKGKLVSMKDVLNETVELSKKELKKRYNLPQKELEKRALEIARAAIIFGDLKNDRTNNIIFDIDRFISFEGETGPYVQYTNARILSIIAKSKVKTKEFNLTDELEFKLVKLLDKFPKLAEESFIKYKPNLVANYLINLCQNFNTYYSKVKILNSEEEASRIALLICISQVLQTGLSLLGIQAPKKM